MIRTGFYGGSFNPIHNGHIALAQQFLDDMGLDEVWFVVSPQNPFKRNANDLMADKARLEIVRAATANEPRFCATDYELHLPTPSYTWRTLQALAHDEPQRSFALSEPTIGCRFPSGITTKTYSPAMTSRYFHAVATT